MHAYKLTFGWDYVSWPIFSSTDPNDPYPDIRPLISSELASDLGRWAEDMGVAYADENGIIRPSREVADELDRRYDELTSRLIAEGVDVVQEDRWWRR